MLLTHPIQPQKKGPTRGRPDHLNIRKNLFVAFVRFLRDLYPYKQTHGDYETNGEQSQQANVRTEKLFHYDVVHIPAPFKKRPCG
jgi:hypothetical protein